MAAHGIAPIDLVVVNLYPFEATSRSRRRRSTRRSRTSTSAGRRCCARRRRTTSGSRSWSIPTTTRDHRELATRSGELSAGQRLRARAQGVRAHRRVRRGDRRRTCRRSTTAPPRPGTGAVAARAARTRSTHAVAAALRAALRREPAPERRVLRRRAVAAVADREHAADDRGRRGARRQAALVQQHPRSRRRARPVPRVRRASGDRRQAQQPVRRRRPTRDLAAAYRRARDADATSAFGGIVAVNREVDAALAKLLVETFLECVVAPGYSAAARDLLASKKNLRLVAAAGDWRAPTGELAWSDAHDRGRRARPDASITAWSTLAGAKVATDAAAHRRGARGSSSSRGGWPSTSSRTRSCSRRAASTVGDRGRADEPRRLGADLRAQGRRARCAARSSRPTRSSRSATVSTCSRPRARSRSSSRAARCATRK